MAGQDDDLQPAAGAEVKGALQERRAAWIGVDEGVVEYDGQGPVVVRRQQLGDRQAYRGSDLLPRPAAQDVERQGLWHVRAHEFDAGELIAGEPGNCLCTRSEHGLEVESDLLRQRP